MLASHRNLLDNNTVKNASILNNPMFTNNQNNSQKNGSLIGKNPTVNTNKNV